MPGYVVLRGLPDGLTDAEMAWAGAARGLSGDSEQFAPGFPLVVDADGFPLELLLSFCLSKRGGSASTLSLYVHTLVRLLEFLEYRGKASLLDAVPRDLTEYRLYRTEAAARPISDYSFRVEAAALRQFYAWAHESGRLARSPVKVLARSGRDNLATNRIRHSKIRHVDAHLYRELLRVASEQVSSAGLRSGSERNTAAIKTLVTTGLRIQELASLLTFDLDHGTVLNSASRVEIEAITKYQVHRSVLVPAYALNAIRLYRNIERPNVVVRAQRSLQCHLDSCFVVTEFDAFTKEVAGIWRGRHRQYPLHRIPVDMRQRAVAIAPDGSIEPLCLFISDRRGLGMTRSGWEGVFSMLSEKLIRRNPADSRLRKVTPHDLRHTFAINYLRAAQADRLREKPDKVLKDGPPLRDPLIDLQELLGHATASQTMQYLRYVEDIDRVIATAALVPDSAGAGDGAEKA